MQYKHLFTFGNHALMLIMLTLSAVCFWSCSDEKDEPGIPSPSNDYNSVTINSDGTATGGAVFSRLDGETFFIDHVKYKVVDTHLEIIGYDRQELPQEPKRYAEVTLDGTLYKTREIGAEAFVGSGIKTLVIPSTVTFASYRSLSIPTLVSIKLPEGLKGMDYYCLDGCRSLTSITLPAGLISIGPLCFQDCSALVSITIPDGVKSLQSGVIYGCTSLTSIILPKELTSIDAANFIECPSLAEMTFRSDVPKYPQYYNWQKTKPKAYVPQQFLENYKQSDIAEGFSEIIGY